MFKGTSDSRHFLDRTGSHSTKPSRSTLGIKGQDQQSESAPCLDNTVRLRELGLKRTRLIEEIEQLSVNLHKGSVHQRAEAGRRKAAVQDQIAKVKDEIKMLWYQESPSIVWDVAEDILSSEIFGELVAKVAERRKEIENELGFNPGDIRAWRHGQRKQKDKDDLPDPIHRRKITHKGFRGWA